MEGQLGYEGEEYNYENRGYLVREQRLTEL